MEVRAAGYAVNGGAINPPALLLNPPSGPDGLGIQRVKGVAEFTDSLVGLGVNVFNGKTLIQQLTTQTQLFLQPIDDPTIVFNDTVEFAVASRRSIKLGRNEPGPPPPNMTFAQLANYSPFVFNCAFTLTNIPASATAVRAFLGTADAYQYIGQPIVETPIPFFPTSVTVEPDPAAPTDPTRRFVSLYALCVDPRVPGALNNPPIPDYVYFTLYVDGVNYEVT